VTIVKKFQSLEMVQGPISNRWNFFPLLLLMAFCAHAQTFTIRDLGTLGRRQQPRV
jgi:hypothetical protein